MVRTQKKVVRTQKKWSEDKKVVRTRGQNTKKWSEHVVRTHKKNGQNTKKVVRTQKSGKNTKKWQEHKKVARTQKSGKNTKKWSEHKK